MADNSVDTSDNVRHADDAARAAAKERMQAALKAKESGQEIEVDTAGLESTVEDAQISGGTKEDSPKKKKKGQSKHIENVRIYSPFHTYYDGDAISVSAENLTGPFDILSDHKNFMSLLVPSPVVIRSDRGEEKIKIDRAVMHVRDNRITIFLDV